MEGSALKIAKQPKAILAADSKDNDGNPVHSDFRSNHSLLTQKMRDFKLLFWNTCLDSIQSYILLNKMCEVF